MTDARQLAGVIGPTLVALGATEALNMDIFASQIAPVVYLNGAILFVAGLAIVRAHNRWTWNWPVALTLTGWIAIAGGLYRMAAPATPQAAPGAFTHTVLAGIVVAGAVLSYQAYRPKSALSETPD
jgi:hypothetical protein